MDAVIDRWVLLKMAYLSTQASFGPPHQPLPTLSFWKVPQKPVHVLHVYGWNSAQQHCEAKTCWKYCHQCHIKINQNRKQQRVVLTNRELHRPATTKDKELSLVFKRRCRELFPDGDTSSMPKGKIISRPITVWGTNNGRSSWLHSTFIVSSKFDI